MTRSRRIATVTVGLTLSLAGVGAFAQTAPAKPQREAVVQQMTSGNFKDAYDGFARLALDKADDPKKVGEDLTNALSCLRRLGRVDQIDDFREKVIAAHAGNWRLLQTAASSYLNDEHYGYIVAGVFNRGYHRGGGRQVGSYERDRVRALQLMQQGLDALKGDADAAGVGEFYWQLALMLLGNRGFDEAWRLQYLSDLSVLPDYDEGGYYYGGGRRGAPVDDKGEPVYYSTPKTWKDAANDGQRWRWALLQTMEADAKRKAEVLYHWACFLQNQFGVQTMQEYRWFFGRGQSDDDTRKDESGTYALHTLGEDETIAKLATGIKRFKLPDDFNYLRVFQEVSSLTGTHAEQAADALAREFENRRQYPRAATCWQDDIRRFGAGRDAWKQKALDQILGNWGVFEPIMTQPAGAGATVEFRFRNGKKVNFTAQEIDVAKLLADVKAYLKGAPGQLDWQTVNIGDLGYRLVEKNQQQYLKGKSADWSLELTPRPNHWDRRVTVATPLQKAGAYLLTAQMDDGNVSRIIIWLADTAIVKKPLDKQAYFYVADAVTGQPVPKANLEFFGYKSQWAGGNSGRYNVTTSQFAEFTDADGQCIPKAADLAQDFSWVIIATTPEGRLAYLGFTGVWYGNYYDAEYNADKVFVMTDRPVYRPGGPVKFKFWVNRAQYDQDGKSPFAGKDFLVQVNDPKGEKVFEKTFTADEYGGFDGELALDKEATLGQYYIFLPGPNQGPRPRPVPGRPGMVEAVKGGAASQPVDPKVVVVVNPCTGGGSFRVEEYKKPEFEVTVEAPKEPVMLGEKIEAKIIAKYYFGAPVTEAKVKYKVLRSSYSANWYPIRYWDWFYGPGYWWFACDYNWYPGWGEWGCKRPTPWWWWGWRRQEPPEVVAEAEVPVGKDGTVKVEIDTGVAKAIHPDTDHRYSVTAEVVDASRRTIVGTGNVLVARKPFKVYAWVDRGHYRTGDAILASFNAHTLDNKPVAKAKGELRLLAIRYEKDKDTGQLKPVENEVGKWDTPTDEEGCARQQLKADKPGQYRIAYKVTDAKAHVIEGGYVFTIIGQDFDGSEFRFNDIELVTDKPEYKPDDTVKLMVNTNRSGAAVLLFVRPTNGVYLPPKVLRLKGKTIEQPIGVVKKDMPNFFVEAVTVHSGKVFSEMREVVVPPEKRVLNVEVAPLRAAGEPAVKDKDKDLSATGLPRYKPGEKAKFKVKLTDPTGEPFSGSAVVSVYDKAVEYISGGSNVPEIKEFFWKWRRHHNPGGETSLAKGGSNILKSKEIGMSFLGVFGASLAEEAELMDASGGEPGGGKGRGEFGRAMKQSADGTAAPPAPSAAPAEGLRGGENRNAALADKAEKSAESLGLQAGEQGAGQPTVEPSVRAKFADTALWVGLLSAKDGTAEVELTMPENLTTWKARVWAMGAGAKCGEGSSEVVTTKNVLIRLEAPRFFVQKDEVVLSGIVHNYLKTNKKVQVVLELDGDCLVPPQGAPVVNVPAPATGPTSAKAGVIPRITLTSDVQVDANGEKRVDWRVKVMQPGEAVVRMKALTDEESDAMEMKFPVFIHGMLKMDSYCGVIRPDEDAVAFDVKVPAERLPEQSRLEIRYSPTLAGAMVDALPYMVDYPYGCTEQTLNRFLPTVITQKVLLNMGLDLKDIQKKRANLNAQEIGDDKARAKDWAYRGGYMSRATAQVKNPVFDEDEVQSMVKAGLQRLTAMQCSDGGWGWFSGWGERSWPHTTALVVHGLQIARANDVAIVPGVLERGVAWLKNYQAEEVRRLKLPKGDRFHKAEADALDAFVYMVLVDEDKDKYDNKEMREFLYREPDRVNLPVYAKAMFGLALHKVGDAEKLKMILDNIRQFLVQDDENQTAYLRLPGNNWWWCWYGSEYEAQGYYLKLLAATDAKGQAASRLVKYLINNRKHASYWNSTRDTAICIEAFADYIKASGEDKPDMTVTIAIDGKGVKDVKINKDNLFSYDNKVVLEGKDVTTGAHKIELTRKGTGPLYCNAYLTNFTLEDPIKSAGLEIKVNRKFYKLVPADKTVKVEGSRGQAVDQKVEKFQRQELKDLSTVKSGDLVEIELTIDSKNDYEYVLFEDMKAAGFEAVELRSGYNRNDLGAYMELRDERVTFFVRQLARGQHSVSYRMRAEIPGKFSALPTKASAMYAPELKANSDEFKIAVTD